MQFDAVICKAITFYIHNLFTASLFSCKRFLSPLLVLRVTEMNTKTEIEG